LDAEWYRTDRFGGLPATDNTIVVPSTSFDPEGDRAAFCKLAVQKVGMQFPDPSSIEASPFPYGSRLPSPFMESVEKPKEHIWTDDGSRMTSGATKGGSKVMYHLLGGGSRE